MLQAREDAIIRVVKHLLAEKGFDAMTVDEVAATVGIAKASLYKHSSSKEDLAAAAMVCAMRHAQAYLQGIAEESPPLEKLRQVVRWTMERKLAGEMPALPSQDSSLRTTLMRNQDYMSRLIEVSNQLGEWIEAARAQGSINPRMPTIAILYTLYARACDPVLEFLKLSGQLTDAQIVDLVLSTCFDGLNAR